MENYFEAICPNCEEKLILSPNDEKYTCAYCGTEFDAKEALKNNADSIQTDFYSNTNQSEYFEANKPLPSNSAKIIQINKRTALVLCVFLGWCGAHKFYERKIGMGILYILTLGLLLWGPIIDFFAILKKSNPYYIEKQ